MRLTTVGAMIMACAFLSACSSGLTATSFGTHVTRTDIQPAEFYPNEKAYAGVWLNYTLARRNVNTELIGNPFDMDKEVFDLVAAQILTQQQPGPRFYFQPKVFDGNLPGQAPREQYKFIAVFNPTVSVSGQELCAGAVPPTLPTLNNVVTLRTAFCRQSTYLTGATTEVANVASVRDRGFTRAISENLLASFQPFKDVNPVEVSDNLLFSRERRDAVRYGFSYSCDRALTCGTDGKQLRSP